MANPGEIWKVIPKTSNKYFSSNLGRIKSKFKILKNCNDSHGYYTVNIFYNGKKRLCLVHRLVMMAFVNNKLNKPCVNHIDGNIINNRLENLEWVTYSENNLHAFRVLNRKPVVNREGKAGSSKKVINIETGRIYDSVSQIDRLGHSEYKYKTLIAKLNGQTPNNTKFIYKEDYYIGES